MPKPPPQKVKITPIKGRPMLHWVGKSAVNVVKHFPAALCEKINVATLPDEPKYSAFMDKDNGHNLLLHGDNMEVLSSLLIGGFRHKIDLIYIDPPFDSKADYVRKVKLRGQETTITGEELTPIEQTQYEDIWANDNYLQFMYERLILLRELLSDKGSIYLHCDHHKSHHLRFLLDEIFGAENFINEIIWNYHGPSAPGQKHFSRKHDSIFWYIKDDNHIFNVDDIRIPYHKTTAGKFDSKGTGFKGGEKADLSNGKIPEDWWIMPIVSRIRTEILNYPTQKPEKLLERIIKASSNPDSIVLDCFCGSGTTAAVSQKLGRRWIAADMNKGAIQTTSKRLTPLVADNSLQQKRGFAHYRINDYDFATEHELREKIISALGLKRNRSGSAVFKYLHGDSLAHVAPLNKPLSKMDLRIVLGELQNLPNETGDIYLIGNGMENELRKEIPKNKKRASNKIHIIDIQQEGVRLYLPPLADVQITKSGKSVQIKIVNYVSPAICAKLQQDEAIFAASIGDFRAQIDRIVFDLDYKEECFCVCEDDTPQKKTEFVRGEYKFTLARAGAKVAVKIIDMLGEETLIVK